MTLDPRSELRDVKGIDDAQKELIRVFMQGAIYCWAKNRRGEPFAVRDLVGGENTDWNGTPLQVLFEKHINMGKDSDASFKAAAKDIGWIVKSLLADDNRTFLAGKAGLVNSYDWVRDEL